MLRRKRPLDGLEQELREHIEAETAEQIERGLTPDEARQAALRRFGNVTRVIEDTRDVWRVRWLDRLAQDLRHASRSLAHHPGVSLVVLLMLATGIGFSTTAFGVINAVLLRPPAYPHPDRVVWIATHDERFQHDTLVRRPTFDLWQSQTSSFERITAFAHEDLAVEAAGAATQERVTSTTGDFWQITGAPTALGRVFGPGEPDAAVLSHEFFTQRLNGDASAIGRTLLLDSRPVTIVGVLAPHFRFPFPQIVEPREPAAYIAMRPPQAKGPAVSVSVAARLKPDVPLDRAREEIRTVEARALGELDERGARQPHTRPAHAEQPRAGQPRAGQPQAGQPQAGQPRAGQAQAGRPRAGQARAQPPRPSAAARHQTVRVERVSERGVRDARPVVLILFAAAGVVLLVAATNAAGLLIARAAARQHEIAIRAALGAGRARLAQQMLVENVLLGLSSGAVGVLFARAALPFIARLGPPGTPGLADARIDWNVLLFSLATALLTSVLCGLGPALSFRSLTLHERLKDEGRTVEGGVRLMRVRRLLVAGQVALALVLLTGAGLLVKSFWRMDVQPAGFAPDHVLVMRVSLSGPTYAARPAQERYQRELLQRLGDAPGVRVVGLDAGSLHSTASLSGARASSGAEGFVSYRAVSPGYLPALGVPLVRGRWLTATEAATGEAVLVNEQLARMVSEGDPIGQQISGGLGGTIVGVVADFKHARLDAAPHPEVYVAHVRFLQARNARLVVRTIGSPSTVAADLRARISDIDRTQPVYAMQTLEEALLESVAPRRFSLLLLTTFAGTALCLALIGMHAVMAYAVAQRTREIGIRMALGAPRHRVLRSLLREALVMASIGIAVGLAVALVGTRVLTSLLYEVEPTDPHTFVAVGLTMAVAATCAGLVPALRAARANPLSALRRT